MPKNWKIILVINLSLLVLATVVVTSKKDFTSTKEFSVPKKPLVLSVNRSCYQGSFARNANLYSELRDYFNTGNEVFLLGKFLVKEKILTIIPQGLKYQICKVDNLVREITFATAKTAELIVGRLNTGNWFVRKVEFPVTTTLTHFQGSVKLNLWLSADEAGMDPLLISQLAAVFAWQIDFSREVRSGDRWRLSVERRMSRGQFIGWGSIIAAEYIASGDSYQAIRYPKDSQYADYYQPDGRSLKRIFLKSPMKFGRITSRFRARRFHPILKTRRPHNGVDYGAPTGTPVMSVGDGRVEAAGRRGSSGIMVRIRHNSVYKTAYLHLSRIAKKVRRGARVRQGQVIGYVGQTGRATGPHLHFAFYENGRFVDPLGRKFPSKDPVPKSKLADFKKIADESLSQLPEWKAVAPPLAEN